VRLNGIDLHVELDGDPSSRPLLLLHGFTGSIHAWDGVRSDLAHRFRLILVDLLGHGQSSAPDDPERYSLEHAAHDLLAMLDGLGLQQVAVLGYSMGGRLALRFAVDWPHRVSTLLLESASPGIADPAERAARLEADRVLADRIEQHGVAAFVEDWERQPLLALAAHVSSDVRTVQHAQRLRNSPTGLANSLRGMGAGAQSPLWSALPGLRLPVRLLVGELDPRYRDIAARMLPLLPTARLTIAERAGHTVHVDQPDPFVTWAVA